MGCAYRSSYLLGREPLDGTPFRPRILSKSSLNSPHISFDVLTLSSKIRYNVANRISTPYYTKLYRILSMGVIAYLKVNFLCSSIDARTMVRDIAAHLLTLLNFLKVLKPSSLSDDRE